MINNKVEQIKEHIEAIMEILELPITESIRTPLYELQRCGATSCLRTETTHTWKN